MDISSMLEVQVNEVKEADIKENVTPRDLHPCTTNSVPQLSLEESNFYDLMFGKDISLVRFRKLHCTACDVHIGSAPANSDNMFQHPVLRTLLCAKCRDFYGDGSFEQGEDATDMFCRWCANGGNLYCCSYCSNTFCSKCIRRNFDSAVRKKIEADEKWKCFVCNPADLYSARAICWALLQYVDHVTRLVQTDRHMSPAELEAKMSTDESQCCPRRRKRKRRRTPSNSEEEDETFSPARLNGAMMAPKRKIPKKAIQTYSRVKIENGAVPSYTSVPITIKPRITLQQQNTSNHSEMPSILSCDESPSAYERNTIATHSEVSMSVGPEPNIVHMSMYNPALMNAGTATYVQQSSPVTAPRHVVQPHQVAPSAVNPTVQYQAVQRAQQAPMVSIPNQSSNMLNRTRVLLAKRIRLPAMTVTPNVIDLDSDTEDQTAGHSASNENQQAGSSQQGPAVPVALVRTENTVVKEKRQDASAGRTARSLGDRTSKMFSQRMLPHGREVDFILSNLKAKLHNIFDSSKRDESRKTDLADGYQAITRFHREIRSAVTQLAHINDRVVREYNKWKRSQLKRNVNRVEANKNKTIETASNVEIPLEMICVHESDEEPEDSEETEHTLISPSELVGTTNVVEDMVFFRKKKTVDHAVGASSPLTFEDKSVQVYDVAPQDYEDCIGHSVLSKSDDKPEPEDSTPECSTIQEEHFGKYEEEFISYLQHIEDERMKPEEPEGLTTMGEEETSCTAESTSAGPVQVVPEDDEIVDAIIEAISPESSTKDSTDNAGSDKVDDSAETERRPAMPLIRVLNESLKKKSRQRETSVKSTSSGGEHESLHCGTNNTDGTYMNCCTSSEEDCTIIDE